MANLYDARGAVVQGAEALRRAIAERQTLKTFFPRAEVRAAGDGDRGPIVAVINDDSEDRHETIVDPAGAELENYLRNPVVLYEHGYEFTIGHWPVGRVLKIGRSGSALEADVEFDPEDELAQAIESKYRRGFLRGFSIGFIPLDGTEEMVDGRSRFRYTRWELVELSCVCVPSNPNALSKALEGVADERLAGYLRSFEPGQPGDRWLAATRGLEPTAEPAESDPPPQDDQDALAGPPAALPPGEAGLPADSTASEPPPVEAPSAAPVQASAPAAASPVEPEVRVEWERPLDLLAEVQQAGDPSKLAALVSSDGVGRMIHHAADGTLNWPALAACMARVLSEADIPAALRDAAYRHLADHFVELGIDPPLPGIKEPGELLELALQGRTAYPSSGTHWLYVEPAERGGEVRPVFRDVRGTQTPVAIPAPQGSDPRAWRAAGPRSAAPVGQSPTLADQIAELRRLQEELLAHHVRAGAKFSKATLSKLTALADTCDEVAAACKAAHKTLTGAVSELRQMMAVPDGEDDTKGVGGSAVRNGSGPASPPKPRAAAAPAVPRFARL